MKCGNRSRVRKRVIGAMTEKVVGDERFDD